MNTNIYMQIHVHIFFIYCVCVCVCVSVDIHNQYTQYTHVLYKQKLILDVINHD